MATTFPTGTYGHMIVNTPGIVHYMRLSDSYGATDSADGLYGSASFVTYQQPGALVGDTDTSAYFNGSTSVVNFGNNVNLVGRFSVEIWIKPTINYTSGTATFASKENYTSPVSGWGWYLVGSANGMTSWFVRMAGDQYIVKSTTIPYNDWTHLVVTFDGVTLRQYKNGVLVWDAPGGPGMYTSAYQCILGASTNGQLADRYNPFRGYLDEFAVYNTNLSASTILDHYNRGITSPIQHLKLFVSETVRLYGTGARVSAAKTQFVSENLVLRSDESPSFFNTQGVSETVSLGVTEESLVETAFAGTIATTSETLTLSVTESVSIFTTIESSEEVTLYESTTQDLQAFPSVSETLNLNHTESGVATLLLDLNEKYPQLVRRRQGFIHFAAQRKFNGNISIQSEHVKYVPVASEQQGALGMFILGESALGSESVVTTAISTMLFLVKNSVGLPIAIGYARTNWLQGSIVVGFYEDMSEHTDLLKKFGYATSYRG